MSSNKPVYEIKLTESLKGWLNLPKGRTVEATREVGTRGAFWHVPSLNCDVPYWAAKLVK